MIRSHEVLSAVPAVAFVESGAPLETLKRLVQQACQAQSVLPPVLPLAYEHTRYRVHREAAAGIIPSLRSLCVYPNFISHSFWHVTDASPDGDALQAFEWASNPPGTVSQTKNSKLTLPSAKVFFVLQAW